MIERLRNWFLEYQVLLAMGISLLCFLLLLLVDRPRSIVVLIYSLFSLILIFIGSRLFVPETTENWLTISWGLLLRNIAAWVFMLLGWVGLLRMVVGSTIGWALLKAG